MSLLLLSKATKCFNNLNVLCKKSLAPGNTNYVSGVSCVSWNYGNDWTVCRPVSTVFWWDCMSITGCHTFCKCAYMQLMWLMGMSHTYTASRATSSRILVIFARINVITECYVICRLNDFCLSWVYIHTHTLHVDSLYSVRIHSRAWPTARCNLALSDHFCRF